MQRNVLLDLWKGCERLGTNRLGASAKRTVYVCLILHSVCVSSGPILATPEKLSVSRHILARVTVYLRREHEKQLQPLSR